MRKMMKQLVITYLLLLTSFVSNAQLSQPTKEELGDIVFDIAYRLTSTGVDPIEGVYNMKMTTKIFRGDDIVTQDKSDGKMMVIYCNSKGIIKSDNHILEFLRIGKTATYDVTVNWERTGTASHERVRINGTRFYDTTFSLTYELPMTEVKARFGELYVPGLRVVCTLDCEKIMPSKKDVENAEQCGKVVIK